MVIDKKCRTCGGPYKGQWVHTTNDCIEYLKERIVQARTEVVHELDEKYKKICNLKITAALDEMERQLKSARDSNSLNAESIKKGKARNLKLEKIAEAAAYCYHHGHIEEAAIIFTGLDKALAELERET